jgi:hypothetical protein
MAFTLATAVAEVRTLINEKTASFWDDADIENWIKQGCLDWCEKSRLHIKSDTIALVTNQYTYTASTGSYIDNAISTLHAEFNNKALQRCTFEQLRGHNEMALATDPAPKYYYDQYDGLTFTFYVGTTPSATYNTQLISILFAMRTDDITELPYEYQQTIFLYAASKAKVKERQWQEAALLWQQYINNITFARRDSLEETPMTTDKFRIQ